MKILEYPTDDELYEFLLIQENMKVLKDRLERIREKCKVCGSFYTNKYVCTVTEQESTRIASLSEVCEVIDEEILKANNLIKQVKSVIVRISEITTHSDQMVN